MIKIFIHKRVDIKEQVFNAAFLIIQIYIVNAKKVQLKEGLSNQMLQSIQTWLGQF